MRLIIDLRPTRHNQSLGRFAFSANLKTAHTCAYHCTQLLCMHSTQWFW